MKKEGEKCGSVVPQERRVAIIGAGVVGTTFGAVLSRHGYTIAGVADLTIEVAKKAANRIGKTSYSVDVIETAKKANLVFITTADDAIVPTCETIAAGSGYSEGDVVIHCSGALNSDALVSARDCGAFVASMHPVGVFAEVETAVDQLPYLSYCLEGDSEALAEAEIIINTLGGNLFRVSKEKKVFIHIAACLTANYTLTLFDAAIQLVCRLQLPKEKATSILFPLLKGVVNAVEEKGIPKALTGPIVRGDIHTIQRHVEAIHTDEELVRMYSLLGKRTLPIAVEGEGIDERTASRLEIILNEALKDTNH